MADLPTAVWSGKIGGLRVHVLDDGTRIIDAEDFHRFLNGELSITSVSDELAAFVKGFGTPENGSHDAATPSESDPTGGA